ncbi:MAG: hypothetical protein ABIK76_00335 [candidate division WOR-3 bacterium]
MKYKYFILFSFFFFAYSYDTLWFRRFGTEISEYGGYSAIDGNNNIILCLYTSDRQRMGIIKYSPSGEIMWERNFVIYYGAPREITCDRERNIIIVGFFFNNRSHLIKFSPDGETLWSRGLELGEYGALYGVVTDDSNNIIVSGTLTESDDEDIILAKFSPSGNLIWQRIYDLGWNDWEGLYSVVLDKEGNIIGTGDYGLLENTYFLTMKFDKDGNLIWQKSLDFEDTDTGHEIIIDSFNNIYACGTIACGLRVTSILIKYNKEGETLFTRRYITNYDNCFWGLALDRLGNILVIGDMITETLPNITGVCILLKYSPSGESLFFQYYNFASEMLGVDIHFDKYENIYVSGWIKDYPEDDWDIYLMKLLYTSIIKEERNNKKIIYFEKYKEIFDITGKKIKPQKIPSKGIYFLKEDKRIKKHITVIKR